MHCAIPRPHTLRPPPLHFVVHQHVKLGQEALLCGPPKAEIHRQEASEQVRTAQVGIHLLAGARLKLAQALEDVVIGTELH